MREWEQQPGETAAAYRAFAAYRDLGAGRTLAAAADLIYNRPRTGPREAPGNVKRWSREHDWIARAQALDARDEAIAREAVEQHIRWHAHELEEQRHALRRRMLDVARKAADRAEAILDAPMYQTVEREEEDAAGITRVVVRNPAGWNTNTARHMFAIAAKAIEPVESTDKQPDIEFDKLTDDEVDSIAANNGDVRRALGDDRLREVRKLP